MRTLACVASVACLLSACTGRSYDLLDAAGTYREHPDVLENAANLIGDGAPEDAVVRDLKRHIRIERVSAALDENNEAEIVIFVLRTYGLSISGRAVGLIYMPNYNRDYLGVWTEAVFEECSQDALDALYDHERNLSAVYCRLNDNWLAYQYSN